MKNKEYSFSPSWVWLGLPIGVIGLLILSAATSKKGSYRYLHCTPCNRVVRRQRLTAHLILTAALLGGLLLWGVLAAANPYLGLVGLAMLIGGVVLSARRAAKASLMLRAERTKRYIAFREVHANLLASLPPVG
jgi:hypothetical protein